MSSLVALNLAMSVVGLGLYAYFRFVRGAGRPDTHGDSRWSTARDLKALRRAGAGDGIPLGWMGRRLLQSPAEDNVLAFGVQRSGKTSALAVPALLTWRGAAIATSTKEELVRLTGRHRAGLGPVYVFAPLDADTSWVDRLGLYSVTWNPLSECQTAGAAAELADLFTSSGKTGDAAHWYLSAANLLTALFLVHHDRGGDLAEVLADLNRTPLNGYAVLANQATGKARDILSGFAATPEKEAGSVLSTARSSLSLWLDDRVARATGVSDSAAQLDLGELLSRGATLYLVAPAEEADRCRPLFSALLATLLRQATTRARDLGGVLTPRLLLLCSTRPPTSRGYRAWRPTSRPVRARASSPSSASTTWRSSSTAMAEDARTIWNNCRARLLLPGQGDLKTLDHFSRAIGSETVLYESKSWGRGGTSTSQARTGRPLGSADRLRRSQEAVLVYANAPPARLSLRRWDQVPEWRTAVRSTAPSET